MSSESSRFQHLLQPIRDLSKNWNIDLAQELEEYLDELENLTIAFDQDGVQSARAALASSSSSSVQLMNFAEAALLIQGTSMIYSRKVEYLYALVFQTLSHLSKQQDDGAGAAGSVDNDGDDDDEGEGEADENGEGAGKKKSRRKRQELDVFANPLPIYDELEEARNITLKKTAQQQQQAAQVRHGRLDMTKTKNNIQASIALMGSLVPDERDHGETFKLLSCHLHPSGVLLMDEASKKYLSDEHAKYDAGSFSSHGVTMTPSASTSQRLQQTPRAKLNFDSSATTDGYGPGGGAFENGGDNHDHDDDDDENNDPMDDGGYDFGGGYDPVDGQDGDALQHEGMEDIFAAPMKPEPRNDHTTPGTGRATTPVSSNRVNRVVAGVADVKDPWAPLDAYDASKSTVREFRKGRSYPARSAKKMLINKNKKSKGTEDDELDGVDDPAFKEKFLLSANRPQWSTWVWNDIDDRALETKFKRKYCKTQCLMTSCESLWRLEAKWKSLLRKSVASESQSAQAILLQELAEEEEDQQMHAMTSNSNGGGLGMNDPFVSNPQIDDVDGGGDDDDDDADCDVDNGVDYDGGDDWGQNTSLTLLDSTAVLKNGGVGQPTKEQDDNRVLSYEEICRQHLEEFMKGTEQYIRETDLTRQVNEWQDKLSPILREQDAHPPFDIHKYGRNILDRLETGGETKAKRRKRRIQEDGGDSDDKDDGSAVPFGEVVGGLSQFEVCRMFLASLQLANSGNVQLHHAKTAADQARVPFEMELLSTSNVYESIQHETTVT